MSAFESPRGSGRWVAKFQLNGKQRWVPGGPWATRERAERAERVHRERIETGGRGRSGPQTIYCLFAGNEPVYVGITGSGIRRLKQHRASKDWWNQITSATFEHFASPEEAVQRELELIAKLEPRYNAYRPEPRGEDGADGRSAVGEPAGEASKPLEAAT